MATLEQLLSAPVLKESFSRIRVPQSRLQKFFGFEIDGGRNVNPIGGRSFQYDIFDKTRNLANFRAPGTPPGLRTLNPVGQVTGTIPRIAEKSRILLERVWNNRPIGGPRTQIDRGGVKYIEEQQKYMKQLVTNTREFLISRCLQGSLQVARSGDDWVPVVSGGTLTIDFQIPAANKTQLNMLGAGNIISASWATAGTDIPLHISQIVAAFETLHGYPLTNVWTTSAVRNYVINNTKVIAQGGSVNTPFAQYDYLKDGDDGLQGNKVNAFRCVLRALPWLTWNIYDSVLQVGTTPANTKLVPDNHAFFTPDPDSSWIELLEGSEPVVERDGASPIYPTGFHAWSVPKSEPACYELNTIDNAFPALKIPTCVADGTVVF